MLLFELQLTMKKITISFDFDSIISPKSRKQKIDIHLMKFSRK